MIKKIITHPLFSGSAVMFGGSMIVNGFNYLYHLLMGRILGPADYGSLASIYSILYVVGIVPLSTSFAIVKFISHAKSKKERSGIHQSLQKFVLKLALVVSVIIFLTSPFLAKFLHLKEVVSVALIAPLTFFLLITLVNQASMQGVLKFFGTVGPSLTNAIGKLVLGLVLVFLGLGVTGAVFAILLAIIISYLFSVWLKRGLFDAKPQKDHFSINRFLRYAWPVLMQALSFTAFFTVDVILVKHFFPPFEAGLYAALSTLGKIVYFAAQPITATMFPIVAGKRSRGERYREVFFIAFILTVLISLGIMAAYWLFPDLAIGILYGKDYLAAKAELVWMGGFMALYTANYILVNFLLSIDRTKIVYFTLLVAIGQIVGIIYRHSSLLEVIQVSLVSMFTLFIGVSLYIMSVQIRKLYAKN
ncbi:hypothetical protein A3F62_00115 [Candidatus Woesebacteria bacterium RIFCSPHIGHO2_12_FULL_44_11]|uniref:Polysaccharide biosynthesis protein C-terminal domain-containing protein n=1 Tax=Candidatus Woesebacteria bacterium RIFCSPLOWO2_01_FULL_44_14 TaxID=1802525 RepID=A0A1F8C276_9BACT|nr:MAG: hypothetical protein A3F62_00115 [Candidatus Woesebacteria bacterium RIFCSPHIGHO2_12_FULL_44_11]OGM69929.1 MAG: hypothetical protein A2975_04955 [Candidatus Woesebacteria bacterium RIFCSPLOWO2_01_FULL_44_14]